MVYVLGGTRLDLGIDLHSNPRAREKAREAGDSMNRESEQ